MKKLIVSGDSCTELAFESICHPTWDFSWPKWPEHLAKHLGMELVCLGKGCLLYTSPSPRDVEESRMPSSA